MWAVPVVIAIVAALMLRNLARRCDGDVIRDKPKPDDRSSIQRFRKIVNS